ncbi:phage tail sheath family protein [Chitinophaga barathri]|uniref:Phage tail sheath family protein n=1 Tax=Chitinophaga barathri TaxID=1647451 RepID=A0A3N4MU05_9BACT|nr:phage tail sheath C-terminal domain-containing protein [Chitinophaga barathri]RPD38903.1 phage tail sheath family protein [Chitinophaga barathri]
MLNLANLKTPGVYIDEVPKFPPSVAQVETAIPAFIGYTRLTTLNGESLINKPVRITSLVEYEAIYGARFETFTAAMNTVTGVNVVATPPVAPTALYRMYYSLQMYFSNGGGPCYIVSIGADTTNPTTLLNHTAGLAAIGKEDEPTLLVFPDALSLARGDFYNLYGLALAQCADLKDRFAIIDIFNGHLDYTIPAGDNVIDDNTNGFRTLIGNSNLPYGAAYYPQLETSLSFNYNEEAVTITGTLNGAPVVANSVLRIFEPANAAAEARSLYHVANKLYHEIKNTITAMPLVLPPSSTIAGIYATVDGTRGVWKAPANVSLRFVRRPMVAVDDASQENLNVHTTGKSVNAIRTFSGKGVLVWGARTLAGNDNEWRYVSVRRFFNMVEESTKKATEPFVFEPNDANTWIKVRAMIENFLILQWRAGALAGAKPEHAFYVSVGLGQTMTAQDILEGRMIVEIGMAVVRPAEFIVLRFSHKMQES